MSARNRQNERRINKLRKALRKDTLPAYIDLVQYLKDRKLVDTTGEAVRLIKDGRIKSESHVLGVTTVQVTEDKAVEVFTRFVPARFRPSIEVS